MDDAKNGANHTHFTCEQGVDNFSSYDMMMIGITQAVGGTVSLIGSLAMLAIIILLKRSYNNSIDRIILYLFIAIVINSIGYILRGAGYNNIQTDDGHDTSYCKFTAYYGQASGTIILAAIYCLLLEIFLNALLGKKIGKYEWAYIVTIFFLPLLIATIPLATDSYGKSGPWCWIKDIKIKNESNCTVEHDSTGIALIYTLYFIPAFVMIITGGVVYVSAVYMLRKKLKWHETHYTSLTQLLEQKKILYDLKQLRWYPILYFLINVVLLLVRVISTIADSNNETTIHTNVLLGLWMVSAIVQGFHGFMYVLIFAVTSLNRGVRCDLKRWCGSLQSKCSLYCKKQVNVCYYCMCSSCCASTTREEVTPLINNDLTLEETVSCSIDTQMD